MSEIHPARRLWTVIEPIHAVTYFAPEASAAFEAAGLQGFWRGYFAGRAAPLGAVEAAPVVALFHGFHRSFVERAVPEVWSLCSPAAAVTARASGAVAALGRVGLAPSASVIDILGDLVVAAADDRRPLGATNAALPVPDSALGRLWHACTVLREHRGDGHLAALTAHELGPCDATLLRLAVSGDSLDTVAPFRGWSDDDWTQAAGTLVERGLLLADGRITDAGRALHVEVERLTDRLAADPLRAVGRGLDRLVDELAPLAARAVDAIVPFPNPMGAPRP